MKYLVTQQGNDQYNLIRKVDEGIYTLGGQSMKKATREEQETIISYSVLENKWEVYTNYAPHIRRYRDKVIPDREEFYSDGSEAVLEGVINGSVGVRGKPNLTKEQREKLSKRMKSLHKSK